MFCPCCGIEVQEGTNYCTKCGAKLDGNCHEKKQPGEELVQKEKKTHKLASAKERGPTGVGGWLSLLIFLMTFFWPSMLVGGLYSEFEQIEQTHHMLSASSAWDMYKTFAWLLVTMVVLASIHGGRGLAVERNWDVVKSAIVILWMTGPVAGVVAALGRYMIFGVALWHTEASAVVIAVLTSAFWTIVWTLYLLSSRRVSNTYGGPPVIDPSDEDWG